MIRVNLLPYRAQRRQRQILRHITMTVAVVGTAVLLSLGAHLFASAQLADLTREYDQLRAENQALMKKIGKIKDLDKLREDVQRKLKLVDELQLGRFRSFETLVALSQAIPENVWLTGIDDKGGKLHLNGLGESNKAVANFMRALDQSPFFGDVRLEVIQRTQVGEVPVRLFNLSLDRLHPQAEKAASTASGAES